MSARTVRTSRRAIRIIFIICGSLLVAAGASAQTGTAPLHGVVTDAEGSPLEGVDVQVEGASWRAVTDATGEWSLVVPEGEWTLRFERIGYAAVRRVLHVTAAAPVSRLLVELRREPVRLQGLTVQSSRAPPMAQTVTKETVRQAPPLGEPDVFRALVLLPGVSQPNDLKGRLHLGGGASDETGVALDGHVLQDPFHLLGLMGAFNVAALGRANVLLHHVPPSLGGRGSGFIDLRTRAADLEPSTEAVVSLLSAGATAWRPELPLGLDLLASARLTYMDRIVELAGLDVPLFGYHDAVLRLGREAGAWRTELLAFTTRDRVKDPELERANTGLDYTPLHWGESLVGLRVVRESPGWRVTGRASFNRAIIQFDARPARSTRIDSERDWAAAALEVEHRGRRWQGLAGIAGDWRRNDQTWEARGLIDELLSPNTPAFFSGAEDLRTIAPYGEIQLLPAEDWTLGFGGRLWIHDGALYPAPGVRITRRLGDHATVHLAAERRFQFDAQSEEPIENSVSPPLFLLDEPRRVDALALSTQWQPERLPFGGTGALRLDVFARRFPDRPVLRERPDGASRGDTVAAFPDFRRIESRAYGASASFRGTWGEDVVVQGSYVFNRVREEFAPGAWSPTAWDAPHEVTMFASTRGPWGSRLTAAFQARSGAAVTPVTGVTLAPPDYEPFSLVPRYIEGDRNSLRLPAYRRLDIGVRRTWVAKGAEWTAFFQVLNLLFAGNPLGYDWTQYFRRLDSTETPAPGRSGLPILPSLGLEVRW